MVIEHAVFDIKEDKRAAFESAFAQGALLISASPGYISHGIHGCIETPGRYLILIRWRTREDHTVGFRNSANYPDFKKLLHPFMDPFPLIEHFEAR